MILLLLSLLNQCTKYSNQILDRGYWKSFHWKLLAVFDIMGLLITYHAVGKTLKINLFLQCLANRIFLPDLCILQATPIKGKDIE